MPEPVPLTRELRTRLVALGAGVVICASVLWRVAAGHADPLLLDGPRGARGQETADVSASGCLTCHAGLEDMHPEAELTCVACHGGDDSATSEKRAHVAEPKRRGEDERVAARDADLAWRQFQNPMDLRVVERTCGECHENAVENLFASLHGTTAGHLSDGFYEVGLSKQRGSRFAVFPERDAPRAGGAVSKLDQVPPFRGRGVQNDLATHYSDLPRKECMQCHLWSEGRAVRGRVGFDGDYRGEGCAACHVAYGLDGLSRSADATIPKGEPGHPRRHVMTRAPTTETCTSCHYGDASIGLQFRGLSQLPPNTTGGPDIPGTTDVQLNRAFYLNDPAICPPDVHYERGMHCVDCHTVGDVMGDGRMHGQMEHAVEISCQACHGTFEAPSALQTERGTPLAHLRRDGDRVVLTGKVDGVEHVVPQVVHVLDPGREEYNAEAARAMTGDHSNVECYTCHGAWNVNFLGFHFSRIASLTQLDLLSGKRTPGRVTTQEKVFATWKSFYAGLNERGAVAPYLTGFSTMGSVWNEDGELILDQAMPVTSAGLSGLSMVHHQMHSVRPTARSCVECHRTSATWGMGSPNFRLGRQLAFVADRRGIEVVALQRAELSRSVPLLKFPLPDVVALALQCDSLQGRAEYLYAAEGGRGIHVLDVRDPLAPRRVAFVASVSPRRLELVGDQLFLADGPGGLKIYDVSEPASIRLSGRLATFEAQDVDVQWPWAYVADGPGGLAIVDIGVPIAPRLEAVVDVNGPSAALNETLSVETLFQYSRPLARDGRPQDRRTPARNLCAVLDRRLGPILIDVTEPAAARRLYPTERALERSSARDRPITYRDLALLSQVDPADTQGGEPLAERDYLYVLQESGRGDVRRSRVTLFDVSDPTRVPETREQRTFAAAGNASEELTVVDFYNPPIRQRMLFVAGEAGVYLSDATLSSEPRQLGVVPGLQAAYAVAVEEFPLDRMIDEQGRPLKDISHEGSRWLRRGEIERLLGVDARALGIDRRPDTEGVIGLTARLHLDELDTDGSGFLEGDEYEPGGGGAVDADRDGRLSLLELGLGSGSLGAAPADEGAGPAPVAGPGARVFPDGDLARLLDGVNPYLFDADEDGGLDRRELQAAFFAALDLDGDEALTPDELSRHPGQARGLRFGDAAAQAFFRALEKRRDGRLTQREFRLEDPEWEALDADGDGRVDLGRPRFEFERERGFVPDGAEWPARRDELYPLGPGIRRQDLTERFDADGDGVLDRSELASRPELFEILDRNGDGRAQEAEIENRLGRLTNRGVDRCPDDFLGRWDLDRSGECDADELPFAVRLRLDSE